VDVGGGTTDLSLIAVLEREGNLELQRIAVGEHILLGGDNMDLALAYGVARKLAPRASSWMPGRPARWPMAAACQGAIAGRCGLQSVPVVVPSRGSKLIGGSIRTEVTRDEVLAMLVEGFFPKVAVSDKPKTRARGALTQLGLPYAQDAAVTRHLAAFLSRQVNALAEIDGLTATRSTAPPSCTPRPFCSTAACSRRRRSSSALWKSSTAGWTTRPASPRACWTVPTSIWPWHAARPTTAISPPAAAACASAAARPSPITWAWSQHARHPRHGAAPVRPVPGTVRHGRGHEVALPDEEFGLVVGEPVRLRFFGSSVRRADTVGTMLDFWGRRSWWSCRRSS
jgi:hypothetical protein